MPRGDERGLTRNLPRSAWRLAGKEFASSASGSEDFRSRGWRLISPAGGPDQQLRRWPQPPIEQLRPSLSLSPRLHRAAHHFDTPRCYQLPALQPVLNCFPLLQRRPLLHPKSPASSREVPHEPEVKMPIHSRPPLLFSQCNDHPVPNATTCLFGGHTAAFERAVAIVGIDRRREISNMRIAPAVDISSSLTSHLVIVVPCDDDDCEPPVCWKHPLLEVRDWCSTKKHCAAMSRCCARLLLSHSIRPQTVSSCARMLQGTRNRTSPALLIRNPRCFSRMPRVRALD